MNYTQSNARRGKPKRLLDASAGLSSHNMPMPEVTFIPDDELSRNIRTSPQHLLNPSAGLSSHNVPMPESTFIPDNELSRNIGTSPQHLLNPSAGLSSHNVPMPESTFIPDDELSRKIDRQYYDRQGQPVISYEFIPMQMPQYTARNEDHTENYSKPQLAAQILSQPVVTDMAVQYGTALVGSGRQHFEKYVPVRALKYYFAVDTNYVFGKLAILFFPFTHNDWTVKYEQNVPMQPRYEKNAPDMYIPMMSFLTYVVLAGLVLGAQERFSPEQLSILASSVLAWGIMELIVHTVSLYIMNIETSLATLDLLAYCGYKYVGINVALLSSLPFKKFGYYVALLYFSATLAFFLMRSLKLRVIPQGQISYTATGNRRRLYFIFFVAIIQPLLMWWLSYHLI